MSIKKLALIIVGIMVIGGMLFAYLYSLKQDPRSLISTTSPDITKPPKFLYTISNTKDYRLDRPMAVLVAKSAIYVSDAGNRQVLMFDYNGKFQRELVLADNNKFETPYGLAFDGKNVYVSDTGSGNIYMFDANGNYLRVFPVQGTKLDGPAGLFFKANKLYVTDLRKQQVLCFDTSGKLLKTFGNEGNKTGQLYFPHGVVANDFGSVFVTDSGNNRLQIFNGLGQVINENSDRSKQILTPRGIAMDSEENLWVVAGLENRIMVYTMDGTNVMNFGTEGQDYGQISLPNGLYIDSNYRVYITELGNKRISVFGY